MVVDLGEKDEATAAVLEVAELARVEMLKRDEEYCRQLQREQEFLCLSCSDNFPIDDLAPKAADCRCEVDRQICRTCLNSWIQSKVGEQVRFMFSCS